LQSTRERLARPSATRGAVELVALAALPLALHVGLVLLVGVEHDHQEERDDHHAKHADELDQRQALTVVEVVASRAHCSSPSWCA
jgi:hypothetical protein